MLKSELLEVIANGENSGVEFKRDDVRPEHLAKEVVALANFHGGRILLGVEDDGTITGIQRENLEEWVMDTVFGRYVHPMIQPYYEEVAIEAGLRVAVITLLPGTSKPYVLRHNDREETYVRMGTVSRRATREQQARLFASGGFFHAEVMPVPGSSLADLDLDRVGNYLTAYTGDRTVPESLEAWEARLTGLSFMSARENDSAVCTIAGIVLFGRSPRRCLRQAGVRWMAFEGLSKEYKSLDDDILDGPLIALRRETPGAGSETIEPGLLERLLDRMTPFVTSDDSTVSTGLQRVRRWHYPIEALRESLLNALVHRDWTRAIAVEVVAYSDRLEVSSPGAMQNSMTIEKILAGQRSPRNPLIVGVMRDYGYVDARGMGVRRKIVPLIREASGRDPSFTATDDEVRLTLYPDAAAVGLAAHA